MKKILIIAPLSSGHVQKWLAPISDKYELIFFTLHGAELPPNIKSSKTIVFPKITGSRLDFLLALPYLQFILIKNKPNLIYASFLSSYGVMTGLLFTRIPRLLSVWGTDVNGKPQTSKPLRKIVTYCLKKFEWINAPAHHIKSKLLALGAENSKIEVFQYGIELPNYPNSILANQSTLNLLSIRNWDSLYNIEYVIKEYSKFCQSYVGSSQLTIIGKGSEDKLKRLQSIISNLSFGKGRVIISGFLTFESLVKVYGEHSIFISVPSMDGTPLSVLEAAYVGLIPILSNIDANKELFQDDCAFFCNTNQDGSLAKAIKRASLILNTTLYTELANKNKHYITQNYNYEKNTTRLAEKIEHYIL